VRQSNNNNNNNIFQPIAVETLGLINGSAVSGLGRRTANVSGESREGSFLAVERVDSTLQCSSSS